MTSTDNTRLDRAALAVLVILQTLMLAALYTRTAPHPPLEIPLFALAPFLSSAIALGVGALILDGTGSRAGRIATLIAVIGALVSFGPQKWFDSAIGQIWPAVGLAQLSCVLLIVRALAPMLRRRGGN